MEVSPLDKLYLVCNSITVLSCLIVTDVPKRCKAICITKIFDLNITKASGFHLSPCLSAFDCRDTNLESRPNRSW